MTLIILSESYIAKIFDNTSSTAGNDSKIAVAAIITIVHLSVLQRTLLASAVDRKQTKFRFFAFDTNPLQQGIFHHIAAIFLSNRYKQRSLAGP